MTERRRIGPRARVAAVTAVLVGALSVTGGAATATSAASEPAATFLPGETIQAVAVDIDDDGGREIVRLIPGDDDPYRVFVDVWTDGGTGWERIGEPAPVMRFGTRTEATSHDFIPAATEELSRLIVWRDAGRERVLVASAAAEDYWFVPCCFTVSGIVVGEGSVSLRVLTPDSTSADTVLAVDLDGDATDELVVREVAASGTGRRVDPPSVFHAYRWNGDRFAAVASVDLPPQTSDRVPTVLGDSDGLPGDEVAVTDPGSPVPLLRIALRGPDELVAEGAQVDLAGTGEISVAALPTEPRSLVGVRPDWTFFAEWPAGGELQILRAYDTGGRLMGVLSSSRASQALVADDAAGHLRVHDSAVEATMLIGPTPEAASVAGDVAPYRGPFPGGLEDGTPAFAYAGRLVLAPRATGAARFVAIASLTGARPLGLVGRDGETVALLQTSGRGSDVERAGGLLHAATPMADARIALVPSQATLGTGAARPELIEPTFRGAVADTDDAGAWNVSTSGDGFGLTLAAPPFSRVALSLGDVSLRDVVPPSGNLSLNVASDLLSAADDAVPAALLITTPAGHAHALSGTLTVVRDGPELILETPVAPLSFDVPVSGTTAAGARVVVAGREVAVDGEGAFSTSVGAGLLPSDVRVEAVDQVGNRTSRSTSVVAVVDYRRLPWIPAAAVALVAVAVFAFWRRPVRPGTAAPASSGDGAVLEEIPD